ncbi:MAG: family 1 glycosylhydrolase [Actinomycetota bacterium]|jgi:beta-glucosidase/6-phospho-beta-glucosidase/beta-galactosidase|nr:family 1 glycosylhydrolase [Actinomycetota bacterium]
MTSVLPDGFCFGVAMSGFQVEGGFNGPGEPANNWCWWERSGRVEPSGIGVDFWNRYEEHLDRAAETGCDMVRIGVEWARVEPSEGVVDSSALDRYEAILGAVRDRAMQPMVTLHHFTHPAWLGDDFWIAPDASDRFAAWAEVAVGRLAPLCRHWVTLNEINVMAMGGYLFGLMPPGRRASPIEAAIAADNMLAAHVRAYEVVHRARPDAVVTTNNASVSVYELDRMLVDTLLARSAGVGREDIDAWLAERRDRWYREIAAPSIAERAVRLLTRKAAPRASAASPSPQSELPGRALEAVYSSAHPLTLDVVGIDYYDPVATHHVRLPGRRTAGGRSWMFARELWDDPPYPEGLVSYCRANAAQEVPVWVIENGMCNRVRNGRSYVRSDGWDRPRYLRENVAAVVAAIDAGWPVGGYLHWSLVDNYEWGSYEPRFGIYGVDRERGLRVRQTDSMGFDAAGEYRRIIEGLRTGDRSVLAARR